MTSKEAGKVVKALTWAAAAWTALAISWGARAQAETAATTTRLEPPSDFSPAGRLFVSIALK